MAENEKLAPQATEEKVDKDYPLVRVPMKARVGLLPLSAVLLGLTFFSPTMVAGGNIAAAFSFSDFLKIMFVGNLLLGIYVACMAVIGSREGLTSVFFSRFTLGTVGSKWASFLLGGTQVGWYAVSAAYVAEIYVKAFNMPNSYIFWAVFWCIVMGLTVLYGFKAMEIVSYVAIPLILILTIWVPFLGMKEVGSWAGFFDILPTNPGMTFAVAITTVIGTFASAGTQVANWTRFGKSAVVSAIAAFIAFFIGNGLMIFSGGIGAVAFGQSDIVEVFMKMGIIVFALAILTVNIWTTNDAAAYAFGMAGAEFFNKNNKAPFIIGGVAIATVLAVTGAYNFLIPFLIILGVFIPPLGGTIIGDYLFTWKGKLPDTENVKFVSFRVSNLLAYICGVIVAYVTNMYSIGIPPLQGIFVSLLLVPVFNSIIKNDKHVVTAAK